MSAEEKNKTEEMTEQEKQLSLRQVSVQVLRDYMASIDWKNQTDREIAEFKVAMHHLNRTWYELLKAERKLKDIPYYLSDKKKKKKREKRLYEVRFSKWCYCGELRNNFNWGGDPDFNIYSEEWDSIKTFNTLGTDKLKDTDFNNASCLSWGEFDFEIEK